MRPRYYEWVKKGKDRIPHFIKPEGGKLMLLAGLYDVADLEGVEILPVSVHSNDQNPPPQERRLLYIRSP